MCTVTYLPKDNEGYILTSSRDEKITRPAALPPRVYSLNGKEILFPQDPQAGGSWIACSDNRTACLLNGAFHKHIPAPPYEKSRGQMLLDYFTFPDLTVFMTEYDFSGIEPFTLIVIEPKGLFELRWNSIEIHFSPLDMRIPRIWSSSTLYSETVISKRRSWFQTWLSLNNRFVSEEIRRFHRSAGDGDTENDVLMNRNDILRTVSITSVEKTNSSIEILYEDLIKNTFTSKSIIPVQL